MRLTDDEIKAAMLHPEAEVRLTALRCLAESHSDDDSVMPLVIEAINKYGWQDAFDWIQAADDLRQSPATVDWLIVQLRRDYDTQDMDQANLRFALALALTNAQPELLAPRHREIISLAAFPEQLKGPLNDLLTLDFSDWSKLWAAFEDVGRKAMSRGKFGLQANRRLHRIMRVLARRPDDCAELVLSLLQREYVGHDELLMLWLEPRIGELAGRMKLKAAIPLLLDRLDGDNEGVMEIVGSALVRIGGDDVIEAVSQRWNRLDEDRRLFVTAPLEGIRSDLALKTVLSLLRREKNPELRSALAYAALGQFATEAITAVRRVLLEGGEGGDYWELRYKLIATCTILGEGFPEYEDWHREAVATNYGFEKIKHQIDPYRLADGFA